MYSCYTKRGGISTNLTLRSHGGYVTDVPKYHNAGIWSTDQKILRFMFKTYSSSSSLVITSRWFATSRLASPASVRLLYCMKWIWFERIPFILPRTVFSESICLGVWSWCQWEETSLCNVPYHHNEVIMSIVASQITSHTFVFSTV